MKTIVVALSLLLATLTAGVAIATSVASQAADCSSSGCPR
jgi:hypothetical protein